MPGGEVRILVLESGRPHGRVVSGLAEPVVRAVVIAEAGGGDTEAGALAKAVASELMRSEALPGAAVTATEHSPTGFDCDAALAWAGVDRSLLVALSPDGAAWAEQPWMAPWLILHEDRALPALPLALQTRTAQAFRGRLGKINAAFWRDGVGEIVPAVLARVGLAAEAPRIFVSYRRKEAQGLADQLFEALAERNFDVFLDCFRVPPGIDFQRRLAQEMGDKSIVLAIESKGILESEWTRYEIETARTHGLGLLGLHVPGGTPIPSIDASRRLLLDDGDFPGGFSQGATLAPGRLAAVVTDIVAEHDRALRRRQSLLRNSVQAALAEAGCAVDLEGGPLLSVMDSQGAAQGHVWVCARPPVLGDFHTVRGQMEAAAKPRRIAIVGLTALMEQRRKQELAWLAEVSTYSLFDTGELADLPGWLTRGGG